MDSATTAQQKRHSFQEIESWGVHLATHGLQNITLADLRTAEKALSQTKLGVKGEEDTMRNQDLLWKAFRAGANSALPVPVADQDFGDWTDLYQEYQQFRRTLEE